MPNECFPFVRSLSGFLSHARALIVAAYCERHREMDRMVVTARK